MLDVGVTGGPDGAQLVAFVDRLAGAGSRGTAVTAAHRVVAEQVRSGEPPAGLKRLAQSLHAAAPPRQRRASEDPETPADVVVEEGLVVMSDATDDELVETLGALVRRGLRVVVTATRSATVEAVHRGLPAALSARVAERPSPLPPAELRHLRRLLATSTPERRVRGRQVLPSPDLLPAPAEIAGCCERAERTVEGADSDEVRRLAELLRGLDAERRAAVTAVGRCVGRTTGALHASPDEEWLRPLASQLVHDQLRIEFEKLQDLAARQREAYEQFGGAPPVTEVEPAPESAPEVVREYLRYLEGGGRTRSYFRSAAQREAQPVLQAFRVDGAVPQTAAQLTAVAQHLDLRARAADITQLCATLGAPVPADPQQLGELAEALTVAGGAARSVGALRHDVLFLRQGSPVAVPDLTSAERVARAIVDYDEHGDPAEAADELERLAEELSTTSSSSAASSSDAPRAPEHERVAEALLAHDPDAYAEALGELARARRESEDQKECDRLLARLAESEATLARAWSDPDRGGHDGYGLLCFAAVDSLLAELPAPDSADVVLVLGAGALQADALLLTAVAPRMVAVLGDERRAPSSGTTLLEVLNQASARFLRGDADPGVEAAPGPAAAIPVQHAAGSEG